MKNKKLIAVILAVAIASLAVPLVSAAEFTLAEYDVSNFNSMIAMWSVHPTSGGTCSGAAQTFTGDGRYLHEFKTYLNKTGGPTGHVNCTLWNATDVVETSSTTLDMTTLTTGAQTEYTFSFSGNTTVALGTTYKIGVTIADGTVDGSNYVQGAKDNSAPTGDGALYQWISSAWSTDGYDMIYTIITQDSSGGSSPPDPDEWTIGDIETVELFEFIVPVLVILLPAFLLMAFFGRDKWPLLIGITIGVGLGFYFGLVPLWLVFLVAIGLIGMAYQAVRGGGSD